MEGPVFLVLSLSSQSKSLSRLDLIGISNTFAYSLANNATTFRGASFGFNQKNQLTGSAFAYDGNGNPTTYKGQALTFDPENRMTSYGSLMTAGYRSDNLRAWKQSNGTRTYYYYGGGQLLFEASNGYITARNVFGPDGLVARTGSGGTWVCYTFDQQGNVTHRTDPSGNVLGTYGSDAYGNPTSWANSTAPYDYNGRWGYYKDVETGLYYCQNRYYDPVNGRWLTQDPIGMSGGINLYGYCLGHPLGATDSHGMVGGDGEDAAIVAELADEAADEAMYERLGAISREANAVINCFQIGQLIRELLQFVGGPQVSGPPVQTVFPQNMGPNENFKFVQPNPTGGGAYTQLRTAPDGKEFSAAGRYDDDGFLVFRIDFSSRSGRADHPFPHYHLLKWSPNARKLGGSGEWGDPIEGMPMDVEE